MKTDFKKILKELYTASDKEPTLITVPKQQFLSLEGQGDPNTSKEFMDAIATLYPLAYTIKFMAKKELGKDFTVMPLEALWWVKNIKDFSFADKSKWLWNVLIMQPDFISQELFSRAVIAVKQKKNPPAIDKVKLIMLQEGLSAQILHLGPYAEEKPTIEKLHAFIKEKGYCFDGTTQKHHEIYLSDPHKTAASKLKTIIRQALS